MKNVQKIFWVPIFLDILAQKLNHFSNYLKKSALISKLSILCQIFISIPLGINFAINFSQEDPKVSSPALVSV